MSDRELLELAAKAASIDVVWNENWKCFQRKEPLLGLGGDRHAWVPLDDDGDALRLAATLGLMLNTHGMGLGAHTTPGQTPEAHATAPECDDANHMSSLRRCIVRAAAEIGRAMEN
ncbi:hypothetical protein [Pseudomonas grimontii]|uniref:hypothetical protein n=1 Tax=Pseudomonas grimontii TaxID=129847 RepID=UPI00387ADD96